MKSFSHKTMASSSFYSLSCLFLFISPLLFLSSVNSTLSSSSLIKETCGKLPDKETQKACEQYVSGFLESDEQSHGKKFNEKDFIEDFIFGTTTSGYEMLTKLGMAMIKMANEKKEISVEMQQCINSYEAATNTTLAAFHSFKTKDYTKASSQLLEVSKMVEKCDKPLENLKLKECLDSHKTFVDMAKLPITFIETFQNSAKGSS